ncbi:MAG: PAS domain-containing protein, partial [Methylococcales bacterium]|nr:PAS domain-containing protein [Methylococcales bacterium]
WLHVVSDVLIALSYYSIPLSLMYFIQKRKDLPYAWLFTMGAVFIVACGTTHLMSAILIWIPLYWLDGYLKVFTAIISVATAIAMLKIIPLALKLPTAAELLTEQEKANSEKYKLSSILNNAPVAAFTKDVNYRYKYTNRMVAEIFNLPSTEIIGCLDSNFFDEETVQKIRNYDRRVIEHGERVEIIDTYHLKNGEERVFLTTKEPLIDENGKIYALSGISTDVTELKKSELAQQEASERLHKIANQLPNLVFQFCMRADGSFCLPYASEVLRKIYRLDPADVREDAAAIFTAVHPDDLTSHLETIKKSARELSPWCDEYRLKFADGTECWLLGNALPELEEDGSILWHGFVSDITERKQIELDILNTKNQLQATLNAIPDLMFEVGLDGYYYDVHTPHTELLAKPVEQLLGKKIVDVLPPDAAEVAMAALHESLEKNRSNGRQFKLQLPQGETWFELSITTKLLASDFEQPRFIVLSRDITERKKIELDILNTKNQLQATLNAIPDVLFELDLEGHFQNYYAHRNAKFSMRAEQLLGKKISTILPPDATAICFSALREAQQQGWSSGKQIQLDLANETYWFELSVAIKPTENEQTPHFIVLSRNITERKKILNLLEQEKTKLNTLIQTIPDLVWLKDINGIYQFCNQEFECFFGAKQADILGKTDYDFVSREQADFFLKNDAKVIRDGIPHTNEEWLVFATNGYEGLFETLKTPLKDSTGKITGILSISRNITERKQMELELQRSNADLEQFAYAVSHDMRQPLRMVTSYLSLIEMALAEKLDDETRQFLNFAIDGAKRMDAMILSLLDYSRVGQRTEPLTLISSRAAVDEALAFLKPEIETSGGRVEISGDWIDVVANRDELTRLLQNLVGNALKYHDENKPPVVDVSASATSYTFRVEIRDSGIGIAPNQIDRLFKVFSRLQIRSRFEGTGVGLALCRKIVEHHGGTIGVESEGEGLGCVFWFELPLVTTMS